jgi:UPF0755 protein
MSDVALPTAAPPTAADPHRDHEPHHRGTVIALVLVFLLVAGLLVAGFRYYTWCKGAGVTHDPVTLEVKEGSSGSDVASQLAEAGVTRCGGFVGRILMQRSGRASEIRAGSYELTTNMPLSAVLDALTTAPKAVRTVDLTIPEGYRLTQIADRVQSDLKVSGKKVLRIAQSGDLSLPPYLPKGTPTAEGFLFPDTYRFAKADVTPRAVVDRMLEQFGQEAQGLDLVAGAKRLGYSPYEIVTIASMIEREARVPGDRAKIAAVIYNRLDAGMTLGIDATLLYDDPTPNGQLSASDLKVDSPYNTRINPGLPPTPIASPGADSLRAALHPADVPYKYYVLCGADGHHVFSVGYQEFLADVHRCIG